MDEHAIQSHILDLKVNQARFMESLIHIRKTVERLEGKVDTVTAAMNKGKGALWAVGSGSGVVGGLVTYIGHKIMGQP